MKKRSFLQSFLAFFGLGVGSKVEAEVPVPKVDSIREAIGWGCDRTPLDAYFCGEARKIEEELNHWYFNSEKGDDFVHNEAFFSEPICFEEAENGEEIFYRVSAEVFRQFIEHVKARKMLGPYLVQWTNHFSEVFNPLSNVGKFAVRTNWGIDQNETIALLQEAQNINGRHIPEALEFVDPVKVRAVSDVKA